MSSLVNYWQDLTFNSKVCVAVGGVFAHVVIWRILGRKRVTRNVRDFKKDLVYLFQLPAAETIVNYSPFALKLETWLRLKKIPYESIRSLSKWSKYGQIPFIELNGDHIADSNIIIQELEKKFDKQDDLSVQERSVSRAFVMMIENQTMWSYLYYRYVDVPRMFFKYWTFMNPFKRFITSRTIPSMIKKRLFQHGIGRHSKEEIYQFGIQDIQALSDYLGEKSFMLGEHMTTVDCVVFGHLSQLLFIPIDYPHKEYLEKNCSNLVTYVHRIKDEIWPDWDEVCAKNM